MMISIGHEAYAQREKVILILPPNSSPAKRVIKEAEEGKRLYDATAGHKTRAVLIFENNVVALSTLQSKTLKSRVDDPKQTEDEDDHR